VAKLLHHAHFDMKGGKCAFAAGANISQQTPQTGHSFQSVLGWVSK
jgi:hypothetical protein